MSSGERLRIGFISPDLRGHSVAFFTEAILEHLDRWRFDVYVYRTGGETDAVTERLMTYPATWRDMRRMLPNDRLKGLLADRCHVLVEMSGLTLGNSLQLLSRRPAPVMVSYAGYPNTTGCRFIDARIVDTITDPPGSEAWHVERLIRIEPPFLCYRPPADAPGVSPRPEGSTRTFGCFGFPGKYNARVLGLWAKVLEACPGSRLALKSQTFKDAGVPGLTRGLLARAGLDPARVDILEPTPGLAEHLATYAGVDVALDTYPYHGTTTTCEAMLMGVPTVTLVGGAHVSRVGLSLLSAVGLSDLCARTDEEFVRTAAALMQDAARRRSLRESLRAGLLASPLCDGPAFAARFAGGIEEACRPFRPPA
jgi:predicted O-linked N-acetylglucosamine transferase (SPINDLY family)